MELMVAMVLGLVVVGGLIAIFVQSGRANSEMTRLHQQMENGRFALQILREDLWHAGFWWEYKPTAAPSAIPDPCIVFGTDWTETYKNNFLAMPVYGYADADNPGDTCGSVVDDGKKDTSVLVVRHANTCISDSGTDGNCENESAGKLYLQVSLCNKESPKVIPYILDTDTAKFTLHEKNCTTLANKRKVISNIYYIRDDDVLMRSQLDVAGGKVKQNAADALVEGIQHLLLEYGLDDDGDGNADRFVTAPGNVANWGNVMAVKVYLLARTLDPASGHTDTKTYRLGSTAPITLGPFNDGYNRHVYSTFVRLHNVAGRRDIP